MLNPQQDPPKQPPMNENNSQNSQSIMNPKVVAEQSKTQKQTIDEQENTLIQRAIYQSLKQNNQYIYEDPRQYQKLDQNNLVGLANLGNTCYINVIIQTLFNIPELRNEVLKHQVLDFKKQFDPASRQVLILDIFEQFQKLFLCMIKGTRNYQDPTDLYHFLPMYNPNLFRLGEQNDFFEVLNTFMDIFEQAFEIFNKRDLRVHEYERDGLSHSKIISSSSMKFGENLNASMIMRRADIQEKKDNTFLNLFQCKGTEVIKDLDEKKVFNKQNVSVGILNININAGNLQDGIQQAMESRIFDYMDSQGNRIPEVKNELKLLTPPKNLVVYLNRMQFDIKTYQLQKIDSSFEFNREIFLDQFFDLKEVGNQQKAINQLKVLDFKISQLLQQKKTQPYLLKDNQLMYFAAIDKVLEYLKIKNQEEEEGGSIKFQSIAEISGSFLKGFNSGELRYNQLVSQLEKVKEEIKQSEVSLQTELESLSQKRQKLIQDNFKFQYALSSVIVHQGTANEGHYFCFVYDEVTSSWWKLNDKSTCQVEWKDVSSEALGQNRPNSNACCLFYKQKQPDDKQSKQIQISAHQKNYYKQINQLYQDQIQTYIKFNDMRIKHEKLKDQVMINIQNIQQNLVSSLDQFFNNNYMKIKSLNNIETILYFNCDKTLLMSHLAIEVQKQVEQPRDEQERQILEKSKNMLWHYLSDLLERDLISRQQVTENQLMYFQESFKKVRVVISKMIPYLSQIEEEDLYTKAIANICLIHNYVHQQKIEEIVWKYLGRFISELLCVLVMKGCFLTNIYIQKSLNKKNSPLVTLIYYLNTIYIKNSHYQVYEQINENFKQFLSEDFYYQISMTLKNFIAQDSQQSIVARFEQNLLKKYITISLEESQTQTSNQEEIYLLLETKIQEFQKINSVWLQLGNEIMYNKKKLTPDQMFTMEFTGYEQYLKI